MHLHCVGIGFMFMYAFMHIMYVHLLCQSIQSKSKGDGKEGLIALSIRPYKDSEGVLKGCLSNFSKKTEEVARRAHRNAKNLLQVHNHMSATALRTCNSGNLVRRTVYSASIV